MTPIVKKAQEYALGIIQENCSHYPFHNVQHTTNVFHRTQKLAHEENLSPEDTEDLQIAALFHDTGFAKQYPKNEYIWARIAKNWLKKQNYPEDRIEKIENMIMATVLFATPNNLLEEIIQDADLDNLGRHDNFQSSKNLLKELRTIAKIDISDKKFFTFVYELLSVYQFHTFSGIKERRAKKLAYLEQITDYLISHDYEVPEIREEMQLRTIV